MNTATITSKKKIIDIKEDTFKTLSIMAVQYGTNLKNFIESLLDNVADNYDDEKLYAYLSKNDAEGKKPLDAHEQERFENWLGV